MPRLKVADLWQSKPGGKSIASGHGNASGLKTRLVLMPNNYKKGPKDPDYQLWCYGLSDDYAKESNAQPASGFAPQPGFPQPAAPAAPAGPPAAPAPAAFGNPQPPAEAAQDGPEIGPDGYPTAWEG
jgi:hypothetical protein